MKKGICIMVFGLLATLSFGQIDSSAWEEKTVLMKLKSSNNYETRNKAIQDVWYLTDRSNLILDSLLTREADYFEKDTIIVVSEGTGWFKCYIFANCSSYAEPDGCLMWSMYETIRVKNLINQEWATFVVFANRNEKTFDAYQKLLSVRQEVDYDKKKVILKIGSWSKELEALLKERFKGFEIKAKFPIEYDTYQKDDGIIVFKRPKSNFVEILDARTCRVIEKIKIPISKE